MLIVLSPVTMQIILVIGVLTAIVGGLIAIYQNDIKKVLAYSTVSQLGFMFMALGLGSFSGAMFHLTTHAFFKALLFLAAGCTAAPKGAAGEPASALPLATAIVPNPLPQTTATPAPPGAQTPSSAPRAAARSTIGSTVSRRAASWRVC